MPRRSVILAGTMIVLPLVFVASALVLAVKQVPDFYIRAQCPDNWNTRDRSARLMTRIQDLKNDIRSKSVWGDSFSVEDLNCFFQENMSRRDQGLCSLLPNGFHSPRLVIEGDKLNIGFRYREGFWSFVSWVSLEMWLVPTDTNVIAVQISDLRAGALPIGSQSILESIAEAARDSNIEVTWYRNKRFPVGLFKFYPDQRQPQSQLLRLEVKDGHITIAGRSFLEISPGRYPGTKREN